jgi:hypothetical protein
MEPLLEQRLHRLAAQVAAADQPLVSLKEDARVKRALWVALLSGCS